ncbi:MAG: hypothetical protein WBE76_24050 [Terracidiphilus sp.]
MLEDKSCDHVGRQDVLDAGMLYAVLDLPCFGPNGFRCTREFVGSAGRLFLFARRNLRPQKAATMVSLIIQVAPISSIQIEGGKLRDGLHTVELTAFVLPTYSYLADWEHSRSVTVALGRRAVPAAVGVHIKSRRDSLRPSIASLNLSFLVAPSKGREVETPMELIALIAAESLRLLVREGVEFIASIVKGAGRDSDLIQLNIGDSSLRLPEDSDKAINDAVAKADVHEWISAATADELEGLNKRLKVLYLTRKNQQALVNLATTNVDEVKTRTQMEVNAMEIREVQQMIWRILSSGGHISIQGRKAG